MNRVTEWKKMRREYLRAKGKAYGKVAIVVVTALAYLLLHPIWHNGTEVGEVSVSPRTWDVILTTLILTLLVIPAYKKKLAAAKQIPYVAPVTPSTLPAEEVLVRGAKEPSAPSETLLRATGKGEEVKAEELLRVAPGAKE